MWQAIKKQEIKFDAVLSGYMGQTEHVALTENIIKDVKADNSDALILIDPVMGDNMQKHKANLGTSLKNARSLSPETLITSAPDNKKIGTVLINADSADQLSHDRFETVPHGGGDSLAALFLAHKLKGQSSIDAMEKSVASIFAIMTAANKLKSEELPLISQQDALINAGNIKSRTI